MNSYRILECDRLGGRRSKRSSSGTGGGRAGEVRNIPVLIAIGVNDEGFREILGIRDDAKEAPTITRSFAPFC